MRGSATATATRSRKAKPEQLALIAAPARPAKAGKRPARKGMPAARPALIPPLRDEPFQLPHTLTKSGVRRLDDLTLVELMEELYQSCLASVGREDGRERRTQYDLCQQEARRRKLSDWGWRENT